ncbi:hypothetical protein [Acanthopleuribacter pedis]|uniref:Uncharacterized protein n=1 Tax=Acanthopleuribacter pedis TaxID=442870 RepID=A0A8J7Q987_9BACT|nr:hypothetical protein [Acanthopleuribacter pedis]MBO1319279.1 hypothetical protein [Acanthopleuribacter pedis]
MSGIKSSQPQIKERQFDFGKTRNELGKKLQLGSQSLGIQKVSSQKVQSSQIQELSQPAPKRIEKTDVKPVTYRSFDDFKSDLAQDVKDIKLALQEHKNHPGLEAQLKIAEKNLERAEVLYEHYRLGNDVPGPRMLHRRGQNPTEKYRNTATMLHSMNMTWKGQGTKTQELPVLYAMDKAHTAEDFLHSTGKIYDPIGVQNKLKEWGTPDPSLKSKKKDNGNQKVDIQEEQQIVKKPKSQPKERKKPMSFLDQIKQRENKPVDLEAFSKIEQRQKNNLQKSMVQQEPKNLGHDMQSNFSWLLGAMHRGEPFELVGPLTPRSLIRGSNPDEGSALLREIRALLQNGYEVKEENQTLGTKQTPVIVFTPVEDYDPKEVTMMRLDISAPNDKPKEDELELYTQLGIFRKGFDQEQGPLDLGTVTKKMDVLDQQRQKMDRMDHSHGQNLDKVVVKDDELGVIRGSDKLGVSSQE